MVDRLADAASMQNQLVDVAARGDPIIESLRGLSLGDDDKMDYSQTISQMIKDAQKPAVEEYADRKHIIELLENIDGTLREVLDELKSK